MKKIIWTGLLMLALWEAIFGVAPTPPPHTSTVDSDCGASMDPTGGCRR